MKHLAPLLLFFFLSLGFSGPLPTLAASTATPTPAAATPTPEAEVAERVTEARLINPIGGTAQNPAGVTDVRVVIGRVIQAILGLSGAIALLMFVWGGFIWMTSSGSSEKVKKGLMTLAWFAIGLVVLFTAYALVSQVIRIL